MVPRSAGRPGQDRRPLRCAGGCRRQGSAGSLLLYLPARWFRPPRPICQRRSWATGRATRGHVSGGPPALVMLSLRHRYNDLRGGPVGRAIGGAMLPPTLRPPAHLGSFDRSPDPAGEQWVGDIADGELLPQADAARRAAQRARDGPPPSRRARWRRRTHSGSRCAACRHQEADPRSIPRRDRR